MIPESPTKLPGGDGVARLAEYVRTLGRGPGRSRALTRAEAGDAFSIMLAGEADPVQIGAFLMLMRYRSETAAEVAGLVDAVHIHAGLGSPQNMPALDLDWPSYGAGRTRDQPWFLLSALALAASGTRILMHGTNEFSSGTDTEAALISLGIETARDADDAAAQIARDNFAYWPLARISPELDHILGLRRVLGLRSPVNTAARLLNPFAAENSIEGVFHPPYLDLHLATAETLGYRRLLALKGAGGEAERNPHKIVQARIWNRTTGMSVQEFPTLLPLSAEPKIGGPDVLKSLWHDGIAPPAIIATVIGTIALALAAIGASGGPAELEARAHEVWESRHRRTR